MFKQKFARTLCTFKAYLLVLLKIVLTKICNIEHQTMCCCSRWWGECWGEGARNISRPGKPAFSKRESTGTFIIWTLSGLVMTHSLQIFGLLGTKNGKHHLLGETWRVNWESFFWQFAALEWLHTILTFWVSCFSNVSDTISTPWTMFQGSVEYIQPVFLRPSRGTSPVMTTKILHHS